MSRENSRPNLRKYPRVVLPLHEKDLHQIVGVKAAVISGPQVPVLDLSYGGAALEFGPSSSNYKVGDKLGIQFVYEGNMLKPAASEVVRLSPHAVAVKFKEMTPETRLGFDQIIKDKMIGLNTYQIRSELLNPFERSQDLSCWFHGPRDTNIFIWQRHGHIDKAVIEFDYYLINYEGGQFKLGRSDADTQAEVAGYVAYVKPESNHQGLGASDLEVLKRVTSMISQIPAKNAEIKWLLEILLQKVKNL